MTTISTYTNQGLRVRMQSSGLLPWLIRSADVDQKCKALRYSGDCWAVCQGVTTVVVTLLNCVVVNHKGLNGPWGKIYEVRLYS